MATTRRRPIMVSVRRASKKDSRRKHATAAARPISIASFHRESWDLLRPKLLALALTVALIATLAAFYNADAFYVYDFQVSGLNRLTKGDVERVGGFKGYNIFFVDPALVERTLVQVPEIKSAQVSVGFPNVVQVRVQEREPQMTWIKGNDAVWVDAEGIGFRARSNLVQLPEIRDLDQGAWKADANQRRGVAAVTALRAAWPEAPRHLEWSAARGLALNDEHGWKIYLGDADQMAGKVAKMRVLVSALVTQNAKIKFIDLSKGDPFYQ